MAKDYAAIAAKRIQKPSQQRRAPKFLVYARNKKGKTTFGISAGVDRTLVLDPEHGTDEMRTKDPNVWHIERWEDLDDAYNFLRHGKHDFQWVVVDGMSKYSNMALKYVMKLQEEKSLDRIPGLVQQRDYGKSGELMKDLITRFHNLPMGVVFTAQERMEKAYDSEEDEDLLPGGDDDDDAAVFVPDMPKGVRAALNSVVDVIGRLYVVRTDEGKAERRLWIGESLKYDTGYRSDFPLPDMLPNPSIPRLVRLIRTGSPNPPKASAKAK